MGLEVGAEAVVVLEHHREAHRHDPREQDLFVVVQGKPVLAREGVVAGSAHDEDVNWGDGGLKDVDGWESG